MVARILKFGQIHEDADGNLVFKKFHIDMDHQDIREQEKVILQLTISRLQNELASLNDQLNNDFPLDKALKG